MTPDAVVSRGGFSAARLARLHDALRRHVGPGRLPGLVAAIDRRGSEHVDAIGSVAFDRSEPMRRDTLFRLASVAKPITAVAAMILVEECRLRLDDAVDDLLPLSTFTFPGSADEFMKAVGRLPLAHQPGERWLYHMSAEILGVLIARAAGRPLSAFMRERIFEPLGMKDTGFSVAPAQLDRVATCYQADPATGEISVLEGASNELLAHPCTFESGAGDQMVSTADDLLAFGRMMRDGGACGNGRILSRPTIEL